MKLSRREVLATMSAAAAHGAIAPGAPAAAGFPRKDDFAIPVGTAYLNAAMIHPMPRVAADAVAHGMQLRVSGTVVPSFAGGGAKPLPKVTFAALINAKPSEIAYIPNTSTGENLVVNGLGLDRDFRGNVVTDALHFESAVVHLLELKKKGLDVRIAKTTADGRIDLRDMARLVDKQTRLVEVSSVASYNGFQHDLKAVCDMAHASGAYVYADIIQSAGAVPLDVRATGLDFAACSGFKWLMADFGLGFLYAREELLDRVIQRSQFGYYSGNVDTHDSPLDPEHASAPVVWSLGRDASNHFEAGSIGGNAAGAYAYSASLAYIQQLGVANIQAHRQPLLRRLELEVPRLGYPLLTPPGSTSPIITFGTKDGTLIEKKLAVGKVAARVSKYWFRFSPSVYNDMKDVEQALAALA
jgi:selenocysteine lyase/cysteine desulfurase